MSMKFRVADPNRKDTKYKLTIRVNVDRFLSGLSVDLPPGWFISIDLGDGGLSVLLFRDILGKQDTVKFGCPKDAPLDEVLMAALEHSHAVCALEGEAKDALTPQQKDSDKMANEPALKGDTLGHGKHNEAEKFNERMAARSKAGEEVKDTKTEATGNKPGQPRVASDNWKEEAVWLLQEVERAICNGLRNGLTTESGMLLGKRMSGILGRAKDVVMGVETETNAKA